MRHPQYLKIEDYDYILPQEKIARYPLSERDSSRLLVWRSGQPLVLQYKDIAGCLPQDSLVVFNQTKVVNARLFFRKSTGGRIEIFCLEPAEQYPDIMTGMQQQGEVYWKCLVGGASKWKNDEAVSCASNDDRLQLTASIHRQLSDGYEIHFRWNSSLTFAEVLHLAGQIPIPPYLNRAPEAKDTETYQTIFASEAGSVAAPTAALHFTPAILSSLAGRNIRHTKVTLHVGAGTFKPVKSATMAGHEMHPEFIEVSIDFLRQLLYQLENKRPVIAVGTTSVRTLESLFWIGQQIGHHKIPDFGKISVPQWLPYECEDPLLAPADAIRQVIGHLEARGQSRLITRTQIIIAPPYDFKIVNGIVTNFHQPQSTLLLLIAAFLGPEWRTMYDFALQNHFRFLSYGDGCLLMKHTAQQDHT